MNDPDLFVRRRNFEAIAPLAGIDEPTDLR